MRVRSEDGVKAYRPHQRYQKVFLQSCTVMLVIIVVCYTYVHFDGGQDRTPNRFSQWSVREALQNTFNRLAGQKIVRERKTILLWTSFFSEVDWLPSTKDLNCPVQECDVTSNRSLLVNSSAIILHWRNINPVDLPSFMFSGADAQGSPLVAVFNMESPSHTPMDIMERIKDKVHLTISYRRDSDFFSPYGRIEQRKDTFTMPKFDSSKRNVCWLVSNCQTSSSRETYVNELKKYIDVDVYGTCGTKKCPHQHARDCYKMLAERCKFYLSFENSICKDYVTEKLFYALMFDMVPIVLGGNDYARYLPPHSFIDVADFQNPKKLAEYLLKIANDKTEYLSYFQWKETLEATAVPYLWLCDLCEIVHRKDVLALEPHKDMISWWFSEAKCGSLSEDLADHFKF